MIFTLIDWLYIFVTCYITGSFILRRIYASVHTDFTDIPVGSSIVCGIAVLTAYAGYFSLIGGVGLAANILMLILCALFIFFDRNAYRELFLRISGTIKNFTHGKMIKYVIAALIVCVCAWFTAAGKFAYDTGTYHAQSIHWIESFGVVKGLAWMQTRLGFNSSYFCLCALYSFSFLGRSLHALSGFLAVFVMLYSLSGLSGERNKAEVRVSDFVYIAPFLYFVITAVEIISPSTDFGVIWLILWLCIRWVELVEKEAGTDGFALLCVLAVFLVSIKLSVGVLALLVLKPACELVRDKRWSDIAKYIAMGLVLILPYFIRNYFITGWLVYPFPVLDLFDPDWKIPLEGVKHEADEIVVWARYTKDTALIDQSIKEWFPVWWEEQGQANRYLSVSSFFGAGLFALRMLYSLAGRFLKKEADKTCGDRSYIYLGTIIFLCYAFFMLSAPSNRFGYAYLLVLPLFVSGDVIVNVIPKLSGKAGIRAALTAVTVYMVFAGMLRGAYMFASDDRHYLADNRSGGYAVIQKDYPPAESSSTDWEGMTVYFPVIEGEQIWYHDFPAILYEGNLGGIERRGDSVRDGFRAR